MSQVISLSEIISGNGATIEELSKALKLNGWVLVTTTKSISDAVKNYHEDIERFFVHTTPHEKIIHTEFLEDNNTLDGSVYGYNKTEGFKEGLRLLTGGRLKGSWVPLVCDKAIRHLVEILDSTMLDLIKAIAVPVFKKSIQELASHDIPFLKDIQETSLGLGPTNFAMLDIVYYKNKNPYSTSEVSVASHYDPGLLSLNILSSEPGLQFQTHNGTWIDIPSNLENIGVLWAGELASNITQNSIKPGWHRVIAPEKFIPRLSVWIEICSAIQDLSVMVQTMGKTLLGENQHVKLVNVQVEKKNGGLMEGDKRNNSKFTNKNNNSNKNNYSIMDRKFMTTDRKPMTKIPVKKGETLQNALWRASREYGIPMTKYITYYCPICLHHVDNLMSHFEGEHSGAIEEVEF